MDPTLYADTLEVAALLHCHPVSVPRFKRRHPDFPKPVKYKGKNRWKRSEIAAYARKYLKRENVT